MTKSILRSFVLTLSMLLIIVLFAPIQLINAAAASSDIQFDKTNVLDDLRSSNQFNLINYPYDSTGLIKHPELINVVEYCYSYRQNMQGNFGIYLYFYNPQFLDIVTNSAANKVQIATDYTQDQDGNQVPSEYEKFDLQFCSVSTESNYYRLFYKYKIVDRIGNDGKTIVQRVNSNARRYDISGIELQTKGNTNATDYTVGGTYLFSGYTKGYGADEKAESNLQCEVRNLETIKLDLSGSEDGIDKRTFWRSNSSSRGRNHQNQINSVFFAIDNSTLEKYGSRLQKIKAEWWEYKTRPTIILDDLRIYNELEFYSGKRISDTYEVNRNWTLHDKHFYITSTQYTSLSIYDWSWNGRLGEFGLGGGQVVRSNDIETVLPLLFYTNGVNIGDYTLSSVTLADYFKNYTKSYYNGTIDFNGRSFSADLFSDNVDSGRTRGYNLREFDIGNPDDYWDIKSYDSSHSWWNKLWDYGFGSITTNDDYPDVAPIQMITESDMSAGNLAEHLKINSDDVSRFKSFYNSSVSSKKTAFIFRYAQTDYWAEDLSIFEISASKSHDESGEIRQGTQFFDFDILEFTFNKDGVYTVIPVVNSPIDHISKYTPSIEPTFKNWLAIIIGILMLVLIVLVLAPFMPSIFNAIIWVIALPFRGIKAIINAISNRKKKE